MVQKKEKMGESAPTITPRKRGPGRKRQGTNATNLEIVMMTIHNLEPNPLNPRFNYKDVEDIAKSIDEKGVLDPILVYKAPGMEPHMYRIAEGHRRWYAATQVMRQEVPCIIDHKMTDNIAAERALEYNSARVNLSVLEQATLALKIKDQNQWDEKTLTLNFPHLGSASSVHYLLKMLEWPRSSKQRIHRGETSMHGFTTQEKLAQKIGKFLPNWSVKEARTRLSVKMSRARAQQAQSLISADWNTAFKTSLDRFLTDSTVGITEIQVRGAGDPAAVVASLGSNTRLLRRMQPFLAALGPQKKGELLGSLSENIEISREIFNALSEGVARK